MPFDFCDVTWQGCSLCCSPHAGCAGLWHASTFQETTQSQSGKGFFSWSILQPCHILPCFLAFSPGDPVEVADAPALSPKSARVSTIHSGDPTNCLGQVLLNLTFIFHPDLVWSNLDPPTKTPPKKELEYFACVLTNSSLVTIWGCPIFATNPPFLFPSDSSLECFDLHPPPQCGHAWGQSRNTQRAPILFLNGWSQWSLQDDAMLLFEGQRILSTWLTAKQVNVQILLGAN